jgi:hypothetical protein
VTELVQILPLRQSSESVMACPTHYVEVFEKGRKKPGGMDSARGNQVHHVHAQYAAYCAYKKIPQDVEAFDRFAKGAGPQAIKILDGIRDSLTIDWAHLLATEVPMAMDENLNPTEVSGAIEGMVDDSELPTAYEGTLDTIYSFRAEARIGIDDVKSHMKPFDPDSTLQGKMYSLFAFQHFPWANTVVFRLIFVRYKNLVRSVTYTRDDLPMLMNTVKAARARQLALHEDYVAGKDIPAIANSNCIYCPKLSDASCPIAEFNENMQLPMEQRLNFALWYSQFSKVNNAALKAYVDGTGRPVVLRDYNGKSFSYGPVESESEVYPLFKGTEISISTQCNDCAILLPFVPEGGKCPSCETGYVHLVMPIVSHLETAAFSNPQDTNWMGKLVISSTELKSKLKTKKRVHLDQACQDSADKVTKVQMKVSKPLDCIPETDEDDEEGEESWQES